MIYIYLFTALIIAVLTSIIIEEYRRRTCRNCGSRMDRYYDPEEDAEVMQCPNCGRSYILK